MQRFKIMLSAVTLAAVLGACSQTLQAELDESSLGIQNEPMTEGVNTLQDFVRASQPQWNFARASGNNTCFPEPAIYDDGGLNPGAAPAVWPNADPVGEEGEDGCRTDLEEFPTYYSVEKCNPEEIRVSYTVYLPNSYFDTGRSDTGGHRHDFEGIWVVWRLDGDEWRRTRLVMGRHGDWNNEDWDKAESWNADFTNAGLGLEHPRIFVGWASHAMFSTQDTRFSDIASQLAGNEYRSDKYPADSNPLIEVTKDNDLSRQFEEAKGHFGEGLKQNPFNVAQDLCTF